MFTVDKKILAGLVFAAIAIVLSGCRKDENAPAGEQNEPAVVIGGESWPIFRGGRNLLGVAQGQLPDKLSLVWKFKTGDAVMSSPVIDGGVVYVGSDDGSLYAIDAKSGKKVWSYETEDGIEAPPTVVEGTVYVGSHDTFFYALDAKTGSLKWKHETDAEIVGAANWTKSPDGKETWILVGSHDFNLYCLNSADGKVVWTYESDNFINGSPALDDGTTVFGGCDAMIHVVSLTDGAKTGEVDTGSYIAASAAILARRVYVGNYDNIFMCVDIAAGKVAWEYKESDDAYFSSPAIGEGVVIVGGRDNRLHCISSDDGKGVWTFQTNGAIDSSPVICGDKVVFGSEDGRLYVVTLAEGKRVWSYETGQAIISSPAVAAGLVVVGCDDGYVYAFGQ